MDEVARRVPKQEWFVGKFGNSSYGIKERDLLTPLPEVIRHSRQNQIPLQLLEKSKGCAAICMRRAVTCV